MYQQLPLILYKPPDYDLRSFIEDKCNQDAYALLNNWSEWPGNTLCLIGDEGSGKSHMASIWRQKTNALALDEKAFHEDQTLDLSPFKGRNLVFDSYHHNVSEITFFHLLNFAQSNDLKALLILSREHPQNWKIQLPDLKSRLKAMLVSKIQTPDDDFLANILEKLFLDRALEVSPALVSYLLTRIERSIRAVKELVDDLDAYAFSFKRRKLTREDAKKILYYRETRYHSKPQSK